MGQIVVALRVDGDAEGLQALAAGLADGVAGVLDAPAALVAVQVVGLAVGEDEQQAATGGLQGQALGRVADAGPQAGVIAGLDGLNPAADRRAIGLAKALEAVNAYRVAAAGAEAEHGETVAGGGQALAEEEQAVADGVDDPAAVVDPGVGGQGQVCEQQAGQVPGAAAHLGVEAAGVPLDPGPTVGGEAQVGVEVDGLTIRATAQPGAGRGQGLELIAQALGGAAQVVGEGAGRGLGGQHFLDAAIVRQQTAPFPVPFRQALAIAENQVVLTGGGQVEVEAQPRAAGLAVTGDGDLVHVLGGGLGAVQVVLLVSGAIDADVFAPGEDVLHADADEAGVLLRHRGALGLAAAPAQVGAGLVRGPLLVFGVGGVGDGALG